MGRNRSLSHPDRAESCVFFSVWPYRTSLFQCLVARTSFFERLTVQKKAFLKPYAVPNELSSSVSPSRGSFFQFFSSAEPSKGGQRCPVEGHGAPKVRSAGSKYSHMDAQRGETGVPTTIEAQKQENVKKTSAVEARAGFSRYPKGPEQVFLRL